MASSSAERPKGIYVPRQIDEWKKHPDMLWLEQTNLARFFEQISETVDLMLCYEFLRSMKTRDPNEEFPSGMVKGVVVRYSPRCLYHFYGWDGTGAVVWEQGTKAQPKPDLDKFVRDCPKKGTKYDTFKLGNLVGDPWFGRMRGICSLIFFRNNCNVIASEHLRVILLADSGEKVNWGKLFDNCFRDQLQDYFNYDRVEDCTTPIGPFLTMYIKQYLRIYEKRNVPPVISTLDDLQRELANKARGRRDTTEEGSNKRQRLDPGPSGPALESGSGWGPVTEDFRGRCAAMRDVMDELVEFVHSLEQRKETLENEQLQALENKEIKCAQEVQAAKASAQKTLDAARKEIDEAKDVVANLRTQVSTLTLEVKHSKDLHVALTKEHELAKERVKALQEQNEEYLERCKSLAAACEEAARAPADLAAANFEANKAVFVRRAVENVVTKVHALFRENPVTPAAPSQEFIDLCYDDAMGSLGMQEPVYDWDQDEDEEVLDVFQPRFHSPGIPGEETTPGLQPLAAGDPPTTGGSVRTPPPEIHPQRVAQPISHGIPSESQGIPGALGEEEAQVLVSGETTHHSPERTPPPQPLAALPRPMPPQQSSPPQQPSPPSRLSTPPPQPSPAQAPRDTVIPPTVKPPSKSIAEHKSALAEIEADNNLEEQSDDIQGDDDFGIAIEETIKYFDANPDLVTHYSNPQAENVKCVCCNKMLGQTVFDVYQHCGTERKQHVLMHRGVAAAIKKIYGGEDPPRRQGPQRPREETRPNRQSADRRSRHRY